MLVSVREHKMIQMPSERKIIRKLAAILSADVKGVSVLMADNERFLTSLRHAVWGLALDSCRPCIILLILTPRPRSAE